MLDEPKNIDYLASEIIKANRNHLSQQSVLNTLIRERDDLQKALSNIIKAIEQGLINDTMKKRMNELEEQIKILEDKITVEEYKKQKELSYENAVAYLQKALYRGVRLSVGAGAYVVKQHLLSNPRDGI